MTDRISPWLKEHYTLGVARWLLWSVVIIFLLVLGGFLMTTGFAVWSYINGGRCVAWNPINTFAELFE